LIDKHRIFLLMARLDTVLQMKGDKSSKNVEVSFDFGTVKIGV